MRKLLVILFCSAFFTVASQNQMKIQNEIVAQKLDTVCLVYISKKSKRPEYGGLERTIIRRLLKAGEVIVLDSNLRPTMLLQDSAMIYSQLFYPERYWDDNRVRVWKIKAKKRLSERLKIFSFLARAESELAGLVLSSDTLAPVGAKIVIRRINGIAVGIFYSDSVTGRYSFKLPLDEYHYEVFASGFLYSFGEFNLKTKGVTNRNILLPRADLTNRIVLKNIFFEFNQATLRSESLRELDALANFLKETPTLQIEISGHTDSRGTKAYNERLSEARAKAVVDYLIFEGVASERLSYRGCGFKEPIAPNTLPDGRDNPEGRQANRRTEFKVLKI